MLPHGTIKVILILWQTDLQLSSCLLHLPKDLHSVERKHPSCCMLRLSNSTLLSVWLITRSCSLMQQVGKPLTQVREGLTWATCWETMGYWELEKQQIAAALLLHVQVKLMETSDSNGQCPVAAVVLKLNPGICGLPGSHMSDKAGCIIQLHGLCVPCETWGQLRYQRKECRKCGSLLCFNSSCYHLLPQEERGGWAGERLSSSSSCLVESALGQSQPSSL